MASKDKCDSQPTMQSHTTTKKSTFDCARTEDLQEIDEAELRQTGEYEDSNVVLPETTLPFNSPYVAYAPKHHPFTMHSRYTFLEGNETSSRDISGSAEDLTGYKGTTGGLLNTSKFSESSPDLRVDSYQSPQDCVTLGVTDIKTNVENESEHENEGNAKHERENENGSVSSTETKHENEGKVRLETKWVTKTAHEKRPELSASTFEAESTKLDQNFPSDVEDDRSSSGTSVQRLSKNDDKEATTHVLCSEDSDVNPVSEKTENIADDDGETFDKGWKTILHSGKAELRKSLENLNSFRQGLNSRENLEKYENFVRVDTTALQLSDREESVEHASEIGMEVKECEMGLKRDDDIAELDESEVLRNEKRQKTSQEGHCTKSTTETTGNSLMKNMMGMFCMLGLKDSPKGGFYENAGVCRRQGILHGDAFNVEQEIHMEEPETYWSTDDQPQVRKENRKQLFISTEEQTALKETVSFTEAENLPNWQQGVALVDPVTESRNVGQLKALTQRSVNEDSRKPETVEENISDFTSEKKTRLDETSLDDKDFFLDQVPDTTPRKADVENGREGKVVEYQNTGVKIEKAFQTTVCQSPFKLPEENSRSDNEEHEFEQELQRTGELAMKGNNVTSLAKKDEGFLMTNPADEVGLPQESTTTEKSFQDSINRTSLEINGNKWSHTFIIPPRTANVSSSSRNFSGVFTVLVLDSHLTPTSPKLKPTLVTLNLIPQETWSQGHDTEVSQVGIRMNFEERFHSEADTGIQVPSADIGCEVSVSNSVEEQLVSGDDDLGRRTGGVEIILDNHIQERVHKIDVKGFHEERLSDQLMCFETDKLVEEKVIKEEKGPRVAWPTLDAVLSPGREIMEVIDKEERSLKYELYSEVDGLFTLEERTHENETQRVVKRSEVNSQGISLDVDRVRSSELATQKTVLIVKETRHCEGESFSGLEKEVSEVITKDVNERYISQQGYFSELDEILKPNQIEEIIPDKVEVDFDKKNDLSQTDRYFETLKPVHQPNAEKIEENPLGPSFELFKQTKELELQDQRVEQLPTGSSDLVLHQNSEHSVQTLNTSRKDEQYFEEENLKQNDEEITNEQEILVEKHTTVTVSKDIRLLDTSGDDITLVNFYSDCGRNQGDFNDVRQSVASSLADDSSSVASGYDASVESSSESLHMNSTQNRRDEEDVFVDGDEPVPWDVTVTYPNPETMQREYKVLRASYSNIQPQVYQVGKMNGQATIDDNNNSTQKVMLKIPDQTSPETAQFAENSLHSLHRQHSLPPNEEIFLDNSNQYRTTMDIHQHQSQVITSYVLFQRFGEQESPRTYFELNYDVDEWKVGGEITTREAREREKTFYVSYASLEQDNFVHTAPGSLQSIEEEAPFDEDTYSSTEEFTLQKLPEISPFRTQLNDDNVFSTTEPTVYQELPSSSQDTPGELLVENVDLVDSMLPEISDSFPPMNPQLHDEEIKQETSFLHFQQSEAEEWNQDARETASQPRSTLPRSTLPPTNSPGKVGESDDNRIVESRHSPTSPGTSPLMMQATVWVSNAGEETRKDSFQSPLPPPLPRETPTTVITEDCCDTFENEQEFKTVYNLPQESVHPQELNTGTTPDLQSAQTQTTTITLDVKQGDMNHYRLPGLPSEETPPVAIDVPYPSPSHTINKHPPVSSTIHKDPPPSPPEGRPALWSFAQSVFHTDGQSKTFFKVIDGRRECFQSSTFMYRGERVKVSRGVRIFKNDEESLAQGTGNKQTGDCMLQEDNEGYSEIWDDGNMLTDDGVTLHHDGPVTRSEMMYEMAIEEELFNQYETRSCVWHLQLHGTAGVCTVSSDNLDAIAIEGDNTLLGSRAFTSGHHTWVFQALGIFCAVGVCDPGEDVSNWYNGGKWVWTTDGLQYSNNDGIRRSEFGQWRNEDVLLISLDCDNHTVGILNTSTNVEATLHGFEGQVYPYFNIYKGSSIRLLETSQE